MPETYERDEMPAQPIVETTDETKPHNELSPDLEAVLVDFEKSAGVQFSFVRGVLRGLKPEDRPEFLRALCKQLDQGIVDERTPDPRNLSGLFKNE